MSCEAKRELLDGYVAAVRAYGEAASKLKLQTGILYLEEYRALHHVVDNARLLAEKAYAALTEHEMEHGC